MHLIVGLGNPGKEYENTRHNAGFLAVDKLAAHLNLSWKLQKKLQTEIAKSQHVILAKPQTFMNLSGIAVDGITTIHPVSLSDVIVIHDDIDLALGTIRISFGASSAGHRGVKHIIDYFGSNTFWRLRIGIRPEHPIRDTAEFVIKPFSKEEKKKFPMILQTAVELMIEMIEKKPIVKTVHVK